MKEELDRYSIVAADHRERPLVATEKPVLRYTNPVRTSFTDGAVFLWREDERPLAVAVLSIRDNGLVVRELVSLTERPLECQREGGIAWKPRGGNLVDQTLAGAEPPDASQRRRLRQMRELAGRFRVIKKASPDLDLRLMPQPIYRYAATEAGVIDGAVFALVEATDPDFFLVLEAYREDAASPAEWRYTLARMLSGPVEVELDGKPLWTDEGYWTNPRSISDLTWRFLSAPIRHRNPRFLAFARDVSAFGWAGRRQSEDVLFCPISRRQTAHDSTLAVAYCRRRR